MKAFLSHTSSDKDLVGLVHQKLENQNAWYDAANIENGESIPEKINEGLKYATHYVLFWSRKACESNWVRAELNAAFVRMMANKCKFMIFILDNTPLPELLQPYKYDYIDKKDLQKASDIIVEKIFSQEGSVTRLSEFVNRTKEIGDIEESIRDGYKLIILQGILGIGKSSLAEKAFTWLYPNKAMSRIIIYFNFNRIQFLMKGYSWSTTSELVSSFDNDEEKELLSHDEMKHILKWIDNSNKVALYDEYEQFYSLHKDMNYEDIVDIVNYIFENQVPSLKSMGYNEKTIWSMLKDGAGKSDLQFLIDNKLTNSQTAPFRKVKGYDLKKINDYMAQYNTVKDYNYAVNIVNYPFIVSSNGQTKAKYNIANPDDYLTLVKKGFYLNDYEPKDLVELDSEYVAPTCDHPQLRKVAAEALVKMIKDAKKEGMYLLLNSGYRSYEEQEKIYQETEQKYGGAYAAEYVATPGASEHQTGLGIDMTSQSVVDKQRLVFGDTTEYKWVVENCAKYGFIVRFTEGTDGITGISHEPWHLRYVGKKVAKEIKDQNWTLEEYCLYKNVIPKFKKD